MKIIFVIGCLNGGGAARVLSIIANGLDLQGYDISILSKQHIEPFYELNTNVKIIYPKGKIDYSNIFTIGFSRLKVYFSILNILRLKKPDVVIPFFYNN